MITNKTKIDLFFLRYVYHGIILLHLTYLHPNILQENCYFLPFDPITKGGFGGFDITKTSKKEMIKS